MMPIRSDRANASLARFVTTAPAPFVEFREAVAPYEYVGIVEFDRTRMKWLGSGRKIGAPTRTARPTNTPVVRTHKYLSCQ
jgi:hypothetical protein